MNEKKKKKFEWCIEIPGYLFVILIFLSIWINEYRWKLFWTGIFFIVVAILNFAVKQHREGAKK
ncbi:MAG: hypothetical protein KAX33_10730 [Candidatus Lokiarchaeota archaeon]|nr:hypothetical protein [Candidatus Lokiarchaeota archaeon]